MSLYALAHEMLTTTNPYPVPVEDLFYHNEDGFEVCLCEKISEALESKRERMDGEHARRHNLRICYDVIAEKMAEYIHQYPAPYSFCRKCRVEMGDWLERIRKEYSIGMGELPKNLRLYAGETDEAIALIKELHAKEGKAIDEISKDLQITRRSAQRDLRKLSLGINELDDREVFTERMPFFLGGQPVEMEVRVQEGWPPRYKTAWTLHPLILQENLIQVAVILRSLCRNSCEEDQAEARYVAIDIWNQLSTYAQEKIRASYGADDPELAVFLEVIDVRWPGDRISDCFPRKQKVRELEAKDGSQISDK